MTPTCRSSAWQDRPARAEIKNLNSFRFVEKAINFEIERQREVLEGGGKVVQETRLYDSDRDETRSMRSKEEANDYRYFPDPDLLPLAIDTAFIETARRTLPELPDARRDRFEREHGLSGYDAGVLTASRELADYYEAVVRELGGEAKSAANWVMGDLSGALNRDGLDILASRVSASQLAGLLMRVRDQTISGKIAKDVSRHVGGRRRRRHRDRKRGLERSLTRRHRAARARSRTCEAGEQYRAGKVALSVLRRSGDEACAARPIRSR